jgi:Leucine-rich repeat (LRR) protein
MAGDLDIVEQLQREVKNWNPDKKCKVHSWIKQCEYGRQGRVTRLHLCDRGLSQVPSSVWQLSGLQELYLDKNQLSALPAELGDLSGLRKLLLRNTPLSTLPAELGNLSSLEELRLESNLLSTLPAEVGNLSSLEWLYLGDNQLSTLPAEVSNLSSLRKFELNNNQLHTLPAEMSSLSSLRELNLSHNDFDTLPEVVWHLSSLDILNLSHNRLSILSERLRDLSVLRVFYLNNNQFSILPEALWHLSLLQCLYLQHNKLSILPGEIGNLSKLSRLDLSSNQFSLLPEKLANLSLLEWLAVNDNPLQTPPPEIVAQGMQAIHAYLRQSQHTEVNHDKAKAILERKREPLLPDSTRTLSTEETSVEEGLENGQEPPPLKIFYCYARKDKRLRDELEKHLEPLRRSGQISAWYDREIQPGMDWKQEIDKHLNTSEVILLLISSDFMKSDYCYGREMQQALERHRVGEARVIPVLLRPVDWNETPIQELQALPSDAKPITTWRNRDKAFQDVAEGIRQVVAAFSPKKVKQKGGSVDHEAVVLEIPLRPEDLEPDFSMLTKTRWYRRDPEKFSIHIDNHDFCTKVIEIVAKVSADIESDETISLPIRKSLLRGIERHSESFSILLPLYWENLTDLLERLLREIFASQRPKGHAAHENMLINAEFALHSMQFTLEHAHYELASRLAYAISPEQAEKFGFPDIAAYMSKYQTYYPSGEHFMKEKALAKIYLARECERVGDRFYDVEITGSKSQNRLVPVQRFLLPHDVPVGRGELQMHLPVDAIIDRGSWYLCCLPQILIDTLLLATWRFGATVTEVEGQKYRVGLNMDDYESIGYA